MNVIDYFASLEFMQVILRCSASRRRCEWQGGSLREFHLHETIETST